MPVTEMYFEYDYKGVRENKLAPKDTYTAEQAIATIMRLYNKK